MTDQDLIREAAKYVTLDNDGSRVLMHKLADALEAAVARVIQIEKALREVPMPSTNDPGIFWDAWEAAQTALAGVPAEPATEEKDCCMRCGSDEWTDVDYSGCSDCREPAEPATEEKP